ncbi:MAG: MoaD/ThiS family protein, partial [Bacteroidota bacterium]|nr:MoaD/ThiS family protein [Candidatus Kapabacteria bacterium]MDW8221220.1 MoaD/ThiS family protein [Bacteroidota bacterium]
MTITVKFFALGRELIGTDTVRINLPADSTIHDALEYIREQYPKVAMLPSFLVACNMQYSEHSTRLQEGD